MKKAISILLIVCSLLSLLVPAASAVNFSTNADRKLLQRAVVETALAYYYKGATTQYDSVSLSAGNRWSAGIPRLTLGYSPEEASADDVYYTVCSAYPTDVYYNAFGLRVVNEEVWRQSSATGSYRGNILKGMNLTEEQLAFELGLNSATDIFSNLGERWAATNGLVNPGGMVEGYWTPKQDAAGKELLEEVREKLQPGDIINLRRGDLNEDGEPTEDAGHALMFLGNIFGDGIDYVIHSTGGKYSGSTGEDYLEAGPRNEKNLTRNGTVHIGTYEYLFAGKVKNYYMPDQISVTILRPLNRVTAADLTPNAQFRLHHPAIGLWKNASVKPGRDVKVNDTITYTIKLENATCDTVNQDYIGGGYGAVVTDSTNQTYSDLVLTETIPAGTTLQDVPSDCELDGNTLTWSVPTFYAGTEKTLSYTVRVTGDVQQVVSPKGKLSATGADGFLGTKELRHQVVDQQFPAEKAAAVTASSVAASTAAKRSGVDVAKDVYAAMGYKLNIPAAQDFMDMVLVEMGFAPAAAADKAKLMLADADTLTGEARTLRQMIVPGLVGGKRLYTVDENGVRTGNTRIRTIDQKNLQAGDVLLYINTPFDNAIGARVANDKAYVYLGNDYFAHYVDGKLKKTYDPITLKYSFLDLDEYYNTVTPGFSQVSYSEIFHQALRQDLVFVLRPARVGLVECTPTDVPPAVQLDHNGEITDYADLEKAYNAAANGDTIVLQEDVTTSLQKIKKSITIDLNGHSVTGTNAENDTFRVLEADDGTDITATIKNGTVNGVVYVGNGAKAALEDLTIISEGSVFTPDGTSVERNGSALCRASSGVVTLKNVSIASKNQTVSPIQGTSANITVEDDLKVLIPVGVTWDYSALDLGEEGAEAQVYPGTATRALQARLTPTTGTDAYKAVTFTKSPDVYNETKKTHYASLTEATKAASSGDTLTLLRDVDCSDFDEVSQEYQDGVARYVINKKGYTLDLAGHTIRDTIASQGAFKLGSTTTLKNGTLYARLDGVNATGKVNLENMTILANRNGVSMSKSSTPTLTVDGCTIVAGFASRKMDACYAIDARRGTATIKGGSELYSVSDEAIFVRTATTNDYFGTVVMEDAVLGTSFYSYNYSEGPVKHSTQGVFKMADSIEKRVARETRVVDLGGRQYSFDSDVYALTEVAVTIGGKEYSSLGKALNNTKAGDTLVVQSPITVTDDCVIPADVTLDLNGLSLQLEEGVTMTVSGTVTGGSVDADPAQITLQGSGSFLGITIPEGVTGTVHPDRSLNATYNMAADSTVGISGVVTTGHTAVQMLDLDTKETKAVENGKFFVTSRSAKQMGESKHVVLLAKNGSETFVGQTVELCVKTTAEQILASIDWGDPASAKAGRALIAMLNYGAAAQKYFSYDLSNLANAGIDTYSEKLNINLDDQRNDTSMLYGAGKEMLYGTSCVLGEKLEMKMYFRVPKNTQDVSVQLTYKGSTKTLTLANLTAAESDSTECDYYSYKLQDFSLADLDELVNVTIQVGGATKATAKESLRSYLARFYAMEDKNAPMADAILSYALTIKDLS